MFWIKDSGKREEYSNWFVRDLDEWKLRRDLMPINMMKRTCEQYTKGMLKYWDDNRKQARGKKAIMRFRQSAFRHFMQWMEWDLDEDHGCGGTVFNIYAYERHKNRMDNNDLIFDENWDEIISNSNIWD